MKNGMRKVLAAFLITALLLPLLTSVGSMSVKAAAAPSLSVKQKSLVGIGSAFTLAVKNLDNTKVKTKKWYSSNSKIATVNSQSGYVTAVAKGTTNINLKITYKNKKTATLSCKVTVMIPATKVEFNNATDTADNNNRHLMQVGQQYDFNVTVTPANASDVITYSVDNTSVATVDQNGVVTAISPGTTILNATASLTAAGASKSYINDRVIIEVAAKSANVLSAVITDNSTLTITFDNAVDAATVFDKNNKLLNVVEITPKYDTNGNQASAVGTLTGTLSSDAKVLTVKTTKIFNGSYAIHVSSAIKATTGIEVQNYYTDLTYKDTVAPYFTGYTIDDTGLKVSINFSEAMDFSGLNIVDAKLNITSTATQALPATLALLRGKANYKPSEDYKSLIIDLSSIADYDKNKEFTVVMSGIKDLAGNYPAAGFNVSTLVRTDTTPKPQAVLINLERTGYNTLTATFSRNIRVPGIVLLSNGEYITNGTVDAKDQKKVNYIISANSALLSGIQKVNIGMWESYNVNPSDTTGDIFMTRDVNFTITSARPAITDYKLRMETNNGVDTYMLQLTYNKDVTLMSQTGNLLATRIVTSNNDIISNRNIPYMATAQGNVVTVTLNSGQFNEAGQYTITVPSGFVKDQYYNTNADESIQVSKTATASSVLPAPKSVTQSPVNPSLLYVVFADKVDETSAQAVGNYSIPGVTITKAEVTSNSSSGATITLTVQAGTITYSTVYPITIKNIAGYNNTYTAMAVYNNMISLVENVGPILSGVSYTYANTVTLTFSENIKGNPSFTGIQSGSGNTADLIYSCSITENKVVILLNTTPVKGLPLTIKATANNSITDNSGNAVALGDITLTPTY